MFDNKSKNIIDLATDAGYTRFVDIVKEGGLKDLSASTDIDMLLQKQAYAESDTFADVHNRRFSIATPEEAYISARYLEKCASEVDDDVISRINEACTVYGIPVEVHRGETLKVANEMFPCEEGDRSEKYAGAKEYGTEFENAIAARIMTFPEAAEDYAELAKMASEIPASSMVCALHDVDSYVGADLPWVQSRVGTPEYAVFEKRASVLTVDLGSKQVPFEKLAELEEAINDMGITIDFDANDQYTTKLALEQLPQQAKSAIARLV